MRIKFDPRERIVNLDLTLTELKDLQYMIMMSFDHLLDDKIFCRNFGERDGICCRRCESNLSWREQINQIISSIDDHDRLIESNDIGF